MVFIFLAVVKTKGFKSMNGRMAGWLDSAAGIEGITLGWCIQRKRRVCRL